MGNPNKQQCLVQRNAELAVRAGQCGTLFSGQEASGCTLVRVAVTFLVMPQRLPQRRFVAVWRKLYPPHDVGGAVLQLEGVRLQPGEVVLAMLEFRHTLLEPVDVPVHLCRCGILRVQCCTDQGKLLIVAQLPVRYDLPDRIQCPVDILA